MTAVTENAPVRRAGGVRALWAGNPAAVVQRGLLAARSSSWVVVLSGFFEPVFYLLSMGIGLGALIGTVETTSGLEVSYAAFIAPALLAVSAMNGAIYDSTWNVFFKLNYGKLYEGCCPPRSARSMSRWARSSMPFCAGCSMRPAS